MMGFLIRVSMTRESLMSDGCLLIRSLANIFLSDLYFFTAFQIIMLRHTQRRAVKLQ